MDDELFLLNPHLHPVPRGLPLPDRFLLQVENAPSRPQSCLHPPKRQPRFSQTPTILPPPVLLQSQGRVQAPHKRPLLCVPPS